MSGKKPSDPLTLETQTPPPRKFKPRVLLAWAIAAGADALQIGGFAFFAAAWPVDAALDVVVAVALTFLIGWHIAFIPSFIIKAVPFADLAPTWTLAVLVATRGKSATSDAGPA